jgi:methyl-accepting chemotaxis protein
LQQIVNEVAEINAAVTEIAASATQGASRLHEVSTAVNQIDKVTQHNAAMVEETTAASHALSDETDRLAGLVGHFQVRRDGAGEPIRRASPKPAARPAPRSPAIRVATSSRGAATAAAEDWAEF